MRRRFVTEAYGIEFWTRDRPWVLVLSEIAWWVGSIALGAGLALVVQYLHGAGWTP